MSNQENSRIREAEKTHYDVNSDGEFLSQEEIEGAVLIWSTIIKDFFWNYAGLVETEDVEQLTEKVADFYSKRDRKPGIYVTPATKPDDLDELLLEKGFEVAATDAWMFHQGTSNLEKPSNIKMNLAETEEDIRDFVELFGKCYGGEGEDEAYGELPDYYKEAEREGLKKDLESSTAMNFIATFEGEKAGIGSLRWKEGFVGIYDIGVKPELRGKGIGSAIVEKLVEICEIRDLENIFLQTEKGSRNEEFFRRRGFETEFTGKILVKNDE